MFVTPEIAYENQIHVGLKEVDMQLFQVVTSGIT